MIVHDRKSLKGEIFKCHDYFSCHYGFLETFIKLAFVKNKVRKECAINKGLNHIFKKIYQKYKIFRIKIVFLRR